MFKARPRPKRCGRPAVGQYNRTPRTRRRGRPALTTPRCPISTRTIILKPDSPPDASAGPLKRAWRYLRLAVHLAEGALAVGVVYPISGGDTRRRIRQRWSQRMLAALGVELDTSAADIRPGCLLVANHVSWLDVFVINATAPAAFVSKSEVRDWPLMGWLAARNDTVFLRRGSRGHAKIINAEIGALLDAGRVVALFPEGTTTDGSHVLHFHAALLQPAIESHHPVQPAALTYHGADGSRSRAAAYAGDTSLGASLAAIVRAPRLVARIRTAAPLSTEAGMHRRELAERARGVIVVAVEGVAEPAQAAAPDARLSDELACEETRPGP